MVATSLSSTGKFQCGCERAKRDYATEAPVIHIASAIYRTRSNLQPVKYHLATRIKIASTSTLYGATHLVGEPSMLVLIITWF